MKTTPENNIKRHLLVLLKELGVYSYPNSAGPFSSKGISDRTAIHKGQYVALEVKAPGKRPTELQTKFLREVEEAGGKSFVIDGVESLAKLREWLNESP